MITQGERSPAYVQSLRDKLRVHLIPFFGDRLLSEISAGVVQEYRIHRATPPGDGVDAKRDSDEEGVKKFVRPALSTIHHEIVTLRHVLKTAIRHGWLSHLPDLSAPYKTSGKVSSQQA